MLLTTLRLWFFVERQGTQYVTRHVTRYFESGCYWGFMDDSGSSLLQQHYKDCLPLHLLRVYTHADLIARFKKEKAKTVGKFSAQIAVINCIDVVMYFRFMYIETLFKVES